MCMICALNYALGQQVHQRLNNSLRGKILHIKDFLGINTIGDDHAFHRYDI